MTITAITFDFWQTLYRNAPFDKDLRQKEMQAALAEGSGVEFSLEQIHAAIRVARHTWNKTWLENYRTMSAAEWLDVMLGQLGVTVTAPIYQLMQHRLETGILENRPAVVADIAPLLPELARHYRLAVISDTGLTPGRILRQILVEDNLADYFTHLTFSDEVGRSKPHPDAFLTTLRALDAPPATAVHVGDLLRTDIAGAKNVGMRGVQYTGVKIDESHEAATIKPDAVINHFEQLPPLLAQWGKNGAL